MVIARAAYAAGPLSVLLSGCTLLFEPEPDEGTDRDVGFVAVEYQHAGSTSSLNYLASTPDVEDRAMLVAVLLGANCSASLTPIGGSILAPGESETVRFRANVDSSKTLNNSAGSTAPGAPQVESS